MLTSRGLCQTTQTERFYNPCCLCATYEGNLGPCAAYLEGSRPEHCTYCDHEELCHGRSMWGRHYSYDRASWDRETHDSLRADCVPHQDVVDTNKNSPYYCMSHRDRCWELEQESFYRAFFVNGDPVADTIYFKLRDYRQFWRDLWQCVPYGVTYTIEVIGIIMHRNASSQTNHHYKG